MRRAAIIVCCGLLFAPAALAAPPPSQPVYDAKGRLIQTPFAPPPVVKHLDATRATAIFLKDGKVADWLDRYPKARRVTDATFKDGLWTVKVWWGKAGEIATGTVEDSTGRVTEAWTGPQVAWKMARGGKGAFGGTKINSTLVWLSFCAAFLLGLADWRRPISLRNLDLLVFLSFSVSLWFFNHGEIFTSVPLAYPPLAYLLARMVWIGARNRTTAARPVWPVWLLVGATVFLAGFRIGLNIEASNVIDVGYAGVIGADRIAHGQAPYGHMPVEDKLKPCGPADAAGEIRERIQANGRCESANERGDTYGPVSYEAYLPGYWIRGWSGKWDKLPAAHFTSILFDLLCLAGSALVGLRFGGTRGAATLAFAWVAYPFTQYASSSNTNDAIVPAFLLLGLWLAASDVGRGAFSALSGWTKFGTLLLAPLWASYPELRLRRFLLYALGFTLATLAAFSILLLEPNPAHAVRVFWRRTLGWQIPRQSPFSIWDWRQYHARGIPDLKLVQRGFELVLLAGSLAVAFVPRRKSPLQLAAFTAAIILGFELVLTHWFYLYLPWFFPFAALALLVPVAAAPAQVEEPEAAHGREIRELVPAG